MVLLSVGAALWIGVLYNPLIAVLGMVVCGELTAMASRACRT